MHIPYGREVDDQAVVADRVAGEAVTAAAYRDEDRGLARELDRGDDVGHASASRDERRPFVDGSVPDGALLVVGRVVRLDQLTVELPTQLLEGGPLN